MRILFVTHKFPPQKGGVGVSAQRIATGLAQSSELVHVLHATREFDPGTVQSRPEGQATVFTMGEGEHPAENEQLFETTIRALHQRFDYQVVVGFYAVPTGFTAVYTAKFLGLPSLLCLRGNDLDRAVYHGGQLASLRWALENASAVVGVSRELVRKASLLSGRYDHQYLPNSVDSEVFRPQEVELRPRSLLFTGEMRLKKGSDVLFPTLAQLAGDWSLTVAGGFRGAAESAYRKWAVRNREAASKVEVLSYVRDTDHLRELYNKADLVLNPALWDGMPNSVLEAMACARPVLTTEVGGMCDLIEDGVDGYLLKLSELGEMALAIERILDDPRRFEVGRAARTKVESFHSWEQEGQAFRALLKGLVGSS